MTNLKFSLIELSAEALSRTLSETCMKPVIYRLELTGASIHTASPVLFNVMLLNI